MDDMFWLKLLVLTIWVLALSYIVCKVYLRARWVHHQRVLDELKRDSEKEE